MITAIFEWFEQRNDPFPRWQPDKPPSTLTAFVLHYTWPFRWLIALASVISIVAAVLDVYLFVFVGNLVDWLTAADKASFWADHSTRLIVMSILVLVVLPGLRFFYEVSVHQG
ncbi:MAG: ABC transporter ATP-binding protein, partial [Hyphomicrobiales bacterium]|nr:ABC transporter ATP-binding protein [Hyphomicrobiales bacterium]